MGNPLVEAARGAFARGDLAAAENACRKIAISDRAYPWALTMLSEIGLCRNDTKKALANAELAVSLNPSLVLGYILQAKCLLRAGEFSRALTVAHAGARISTAHAEELDGLGAIFGMLGKHREALDFFKRATSSVRHIPQFLFNRAATERILGELEHAEAHCDALLALDPHYYPAHILRADLSVQTPSRNHSVELEALIAGGTKNWQGEVILRYALGKEYEDVGDEDRAFAQFAAGADLHRSRINYDVAGDIAIINRVMLTQTRSWLETVRTGCRNAAPIFVVGLPRSGTTVVDRIIASHGDVISIGEISVMSVEIARAFAKAPQRPPSSLAASTAPDIDFAELGRRYVDSVTFLAAPGSHRFVDKTLQNYLSCGLIRAALPNAKIILVRRKPMDTCYALYKSHFDGKFSYSYNLNELAEYYIAFDRLAQHWRLTLPPGVFQEVQYEDIIADFEDQCRRLISFLELPWDDGVLRFHENRVPSATASAVQVRRPLYASSVGRWRRHAHRLGPLRERLAKELPLEDLE